MMSDAFLLKGGKGKNRTVKQDVIKYVCYSERGIMSFLMFHMFEDEKILRNFLANLENYKEDKPFKKILGSIQRPKLFIRNIRVFSEMDFNQFGNPDAILFFEIGKNDKWERNLFFIEAKYLDNWHKSNKGKINYSDYLKGQLALKKRMISTYCVNSPRIEEKVTGFYKNEADIKDEKNTRVLDLNNNVDLKLIFEKYFVDLKRVFYVACTNEKNEVNPLNENEMKFIQADKESFCWISINRFIGNISNQRKTMAKLRESIKQDLK